MLEPKDFHSELHSFRSHASSPPPFALTVILILPGLFGFIIFLLSLIAYEERIYYFMFVTKNVESFPISI